MFSSLVSEGLDGLWSSRELLSKFGSEILAAYVCAFWSGWGFCRIQMLVWLLLRYEASVLFWGSWLGLWGSWCFLASNFQNVGLASGGVEGFCERYGLGYGDKEWRGSWSYAEQAQAEWGGNITWGSGCWLGLWGKRIFLPDLWAWMWWQGKEGWLGLCWVVMGELGGGFT